MVWAKSPGSSGHGLKGLISSFSVLLQATDPSIDISAGGDLHINISIPPGFAFQPFPK